MKAVSRDGKYLPQKKKKKNLVKKRNEELTEQAQKEKERTKVSGLE